MYLIVGSTPQSGWQRLMPAFESAGCTVVDQQQVEEWCMSALQSGTPKFDNDSPGASLDARLKKSASEVLNQMASPALFPVNEARYLSVLQAWLEEFPDSQLLLFHSRPESILAEAMEQGNDPQQVLKQWHRDAEKLMSVHRRNRRRSLLVDAEAAFADLEAFFCACKERYDLPDSKPPSMDQRDKAPSREIYKLIASQLVVQTQGLPELVSEIEASSFPMGEPAALSVVDCTEAQKEIQELSYQLKNKMQNFENENERLLLQLHKAQEELEAYLFKSREESEKRKEAQQLKDQVESKLQDIEKENELLHLQLQEVQQELETYYLRYQEENEKRERAEQAVDSTQRQLADTQKRLNLVWQSTSWKLTAPIRAVVLLFKKPFRKSKPATQKVTG